MGLDKESGTVEKGKRGDLIWSTAIPSKTFTSFATSNMSSQMAPCTTQHELWQSVGFKTMIPRAAPAREAWAFGSAQRFQRSAKVFAKMTIGFRPLEVNANQPAI